MTEKEDILREIQKHAANNGGIPLGVKRFLAATGIKKSAWEGRYWVRWTDALKEAGFAPNQWQNKILTDEELVLQLAKLAHRIGHYPVNSEVIFYHSQNPSFPDAGTFQKRLGNSQNRLRLLIEFAESHSEYQDVYEMCTPHIKLKSGKEFEEDRKASVPGRVYMIYSRSLKLYKIGQSDDLKRRYKEIESAVPGKLEEIHVLETDDPSGIERYWHRRFKHHKKINEWFELTDNDVEAFKSRGKSM